MITKDEVMHLADIAMLKIPEEDIDMFTEKISQVISFIETINEVNTENVEPTLQINNDTGLLKDYDEDQVLTREEVLQNTKEHQYGYFKILKVVE